MRMRKKKNLIPRMEACEALWVRDPAARKGRWRELMPGAKALRLELGCGKGRFTAGTAAAHPEDLYVAVERVPDAMVIAMERCRDAGLTNVFFIDGDAAALGEYFAPGEADLIYINFCDPWPSVKHAPRRLTHQNFLRGYRKVLRDGGEIHFKTDDRALFEWSLFQFPKAGFELSQVTRNLHEHGVRGIMTDYEERFYAMGVPINRCVGTKAALPDIPLAEGLAARLAGWEVRPVTEGDFAAVLALEERCADGFCPGGRTVPEEGPRAEGLPPRRAPEQKRVIALWREGAPRAALDLLEGWPRPGTLFIVRFMMEPELRREGFGGSAVAALTGAAHDAGFDRVRLACPSADEEGRAFWTAMGFTGLRRDTLAGERSQPVWIMERAI